MRIFTWKTGAKAKFALSFGLGTLMLVTAFSQTNSIAPASPSEPIPSVNPTLDPSPAPTPSIEPIAAPPSKSGPLEQANYAPVLTLSAPLLSAPVKLASPEELARPAPGAKNFSGPTGIALLRQAWPLILVPGFLLFYVGSTRAKNCGSTASLVLIGSILGLVAFWAGGFAVEFGGIGDANPSLALPFTLEQKAALEHELGFVAGNHRWGLMGSEGFFLNTILEARTSVANLFLFQFGSLLSALLIALGGGLERVRLSALGVFAALVTTVILPLVSNWINGGGWLATLGLEFGLGHGVVDLGGACYLAEAGGTLALALSLSAGARLGRFVADGVSQPIPGHHLPFALLGAILLLGGFGLSSSALSSALASINVLLAAAGGIMGVALLALQGRSVDPLRLCRGLLAGAIAISGAAPLYETWVAFAIGFSGGLIVEGVSGLLARARIDDPAGSIAIFLGAGGWGTLAVGLLADGTDADGFNGVAGPISGLVLGDWHQLAAQAIGLLACFVTTFSLGVLATSLIQRVVGLRVPASIEEQGLDASQVGALGYQADAD